MKRISINVIFVLFVNSIFAQNTNPCDCEKILDFESRLIGNTFVLPVGLSSKTFITQIPFAADIFLINNEIVTKVNLTYNGYLDELIWQEPDYLKFVQLDKDQVIGFRIYEFLNKQNVYFEKIKIKKTNTTDSTYVFAQELLKDKISLFKYFSIYISENQNVTLNGKFFYKPIFKPKNSYVLKLPNNKTIEFEKFRKKLFYAIFPDKKEELEIKFDELKQKKFRTENDLILITKIINQI